MLPSDEPRVEVHTTDRCTATHANHGRCVFGRGHPVDYHSDGSHRWGLAVGEVVRDEAAECGKPGIGGPCTRPMGHLSPSHWHVGESFAICGLDVRHRGPCAAAPGHVGPCVLSLVESHDPGCDVLDIDPAIGHATKPCNCRKRLPHTPPWTLREIAEQALVLYEGEEHDAKQLDDLQGEQFWGGHAATVKLALDAEKKVKRG